MALTQGSQALWNNADLTVGGSPYYAFMWAQRVDRIMFQWTLRVAAGAAPAAAFTFYSTTLEDITKLKDPLNETNLNWTDETPYGAVFSTVPGTVPDASDRLVLGENTAVAYMIKLDVLADLTGFTLRAHGMG